MHLCHPLSSLELYMSLLLLPLLMLVLQPKRSYTTSLLRLKDSESSTIYRSYFIAIPPSSSPFLLDAHDPLILPARVVVVAASNSYSFFAFFLLLFSSFLRTRCRCRLLDYNAHTVSTPSPSTELRRRALRRCNRIAKEGRWAKGGRASVTN